MAAIIPLQAVPNQTLAVPLADQNCELNIYQKSTGLYIDVFKNGLLVIGGVICQDRNRIIRDLYFGFAGDLAFVDLRGTTDPYYTGIGDRYFLTYIEAGELPEGVG